MFDTYEPVPSLSCPFCGTVLDDWQGYEGGKALLLWRQGEPHPVRQRPEEDPSERRLPDSFRIWAYCPSDGQELEAVGRCRDGVWVETKPDW